MSVHKSDIKRITTHVVQAMKANGEKIAMLTAYDYSMAKILDAAGIDILLVGDSASNVMAGHETTLPITLNEMIYHASSVVRAVLRALVVVDLPFGSYQGNSEEALKSAIRIMKESGAHAVKLESSRCPHQPPHHATRLDVASPVHPQTRCPVQQTILPASSTARFSARPHRRAGSSPGCARRSSPRNADLPLYDRLIH